MATGQSELADALAGILYRGLLSLRGTAGSDARYVRIEADHLHNLPSCLARLDADDVLYYYNVERPRYLAALRRLGGEAQAHAPDYRDHWRTVARWLRATRTGGGGRE